jgi:hypothetical protein
VPFRLSVRLVPEALIVIEGDLAPALWGVNATRNEQVLWAASVAPQVIPVTVKSDVGAAIPLNVTGLLVAFSI